MADFPGLDIVHVAVVLASPHVKAFDLPPENSSGGGAPDTTPPVVTVISPTPGLIPGNIRQAANTPLVIDVTDIAPGVAFLRVRIRYALLGMQCTLHNGTTFELGYQQNSTKVVIPNGFRFTLLPDDGWLSGFTLEVDAIDGAGNIAV